MRPEKVIARYIEAYQQLYKRSPRELQIIDNDWIIVNGARLRIIELEHLTKQLEQEYSQVLADKRGLVMRLVKWFKG